jgi:cell division protein FtsZ
MSKSEKSGKVVAVGIGSAGSRIASLLSKENLFVDRFLFISCDENDFVFATDKPKIHIHAPFGRKLTPSIVRGLALQNIEDISRQIKGAEVVFVIAGLGGATGSGLAPLIAQLASEAGSTAIGIAVMPFEFERKLLFNAGIALRWLRKNTNGVIIVDNNNLFKAASESMTLADLYSAANHECVKALSSLFARPTESTLSLGINKVLSTVVCKGYSLLGISNSDSADKTEEALAGAVISIGKLAETNETEKAAVILNCDRSLSASEVAKAVERLGAMVNRNVDVEYAVVHCGTSQLQVSLIASGFKSTKYDDYDPLYKILGDQNLEDQMEYCLPLDFDYLERCD